MCTAFGHAHGNDGGPGVYLLQDDLSGRQWWTITAAAGGGYTIQILTGREDCNPQASFLSTVACGSTTVAMASANGGAGLQTWTLTAVPRPPPTPQTPFVPIFANGIYSIANNGLATCSNLVNYDACGTDNAVILANTAGAFAS